MMALDPNDRYPTPLAVVAALNQFLEPAHRSEADRKNMDGADGNSPMGKADSLAASGIVDLHAGDHARRVLILSPRTAYRAEVRDVLEKHGMSCAEADGADDLRNLLKRFPADVALIDAHLKEESGMEVCRQLRGGGMVSHQKLILVTDDASTPASPEFDGVCDDQARGGDSPAVLLGRVRLALRLKEAEERLDRLVNSLLSTNSQLEQAMQQRDSTAYQRKTC